METILRLAPSFGEWIGLGAEASTGPSDLMRRMDGRRRTRSRPSLIAQVVTSDLRSSR